MEWLYGRNPVYEALRSGRRQFTTLRIADNVQLKGRVNQIRELAVAQSIAIEKVPREKLDQIVSHNQGVALAADDYPYGDVADILDLAAAREQAPFLLILDTLQDPQNLGSLLRTAEIVGVHGVILPHRHTATVTPAVVNASSGACEHLLIAQGNLAQTIKALKQNDVWVVGLDGGQEAQAPDKIRLEGSIALVVGNEGEGMRRLVRESCDHLMRLPMRGQVASLNAAVAGSVALYLAWQARSYL